MMTLWNFDIIISGWLLIRKWDNILIFTCQYTSHAYFDGLIDEEFASVVVILAVFTSVVFASDILLLPCKQIAGKTPTLIQTRHATWFGSTILHLLQKK